MKLTASIMIANTKETIVKEIDTKLEGALEKKRTEVTHAIVPRSFVKMIIEEYKERGFTCEELELQNSFDSPELRISWPTE